ncbi:EAL domain-containing protein [Pseudomonas alliivorans]|uniref:bifunctional diguanylate cyclase/phosphodiesterase n=1 Tax=Pseudomonas alliivorans TaxID=2810613 RepID=UPI001AE4B409|nr:EAL domain-containing protein [Pseudomonas alliivorans]MBP0941349.1 EAL domain-containing protein [Pseudomonas alliivorans]MEE4668681.1 EAL domain-containing protein [Pseudomonas alliivorans]MEE4880750.1 EAL domain-containing protein [Pseudomonas alliivorans]MEE4931118.1 EAL domain-containing protein [Pseudomonas alliivorans]MEE4936392.1 EAL domain-containing protein [Pseudomonas alliivorans]
MKSFESLDPLPGTPTSNTSLARRTLGTMGGMLGALSLVAFISLFYIAHQLNHSAALQSRHLVEKVWQSREKTLIANFKDYAFWGDAYKHLHINVDPEWAYTRNNLGASLYNDFQFEGVFAVDGHEQTVYSVVNGERVTLQLNDWLDSRQDQFIEQAREQGEGDVFTQIRQVDHVPVLLIAAPLTTGGDEQVQQTDSIQSILVLGYRLTPEKLREMGLQYGIQGLREAADAEDAARFPSLEIASGVLLRWDPEQPGMKLVGGLLPVLLTCLATLILIARRVTRKTIRAAELMDRQFELITHSRAALLSSEERFRNVAESASDWVWETDAELRITYLSERFTRVTGHASHPWTGRSLTQLLSCETQSLADWIRLERPMDERAVLRCTHYSLQGAVRISNIAARPIVLDGQIKGYLGIASDITREVETQSRLFHLSQHDALTGLPNRTQMQAFLTRTFEQRTEPGSTVTMLNLDLDSFKPINDVFGHSAGDSVLREVAERLSQCLPPFGLLARQGGDEFLMVATSLATEEDVERLCERLIRHIRRPFTINSQEVFIGLSIGIAVCPLHTHESQDLIRFSDLALYQAKKEGRNTWRFYEPIMSTRITQLREMEKSLRVAIGNDEFTLRYQPRHDVHSGKICGAEALIRWEHPTLGLCMPDQFIGLAEENGLILSLSDWVLHRACRDAAAWDSALLVSVNISAVEFRTPGLVERVRQVLATTGLPSHRLELEVTERVMIHDAQAALTLINELKTLGVRLSMDDFGTGYSSLSYLKMFPFDTLKIDRSFISEIDANTQSLSIVQAIIQLGRSLSMTITAEGVETARQLDCLQSLGCDEAQGYYLNRPMPLASFLDTVRTQTCQSIS